jgi:rSAM/selenodomain-associated transferase 2
MGLLSIIIPVLNEERLIERCLMQLAPLRRSGVEVIVVDGGSRDSTVQRARQQGVRVASVRPERTDTRPVQGCTGIDQRRKPLINEASGKPHLPGSVDRDTRDGTPEWEPTGASTGRAAQMNEGARLARGDLLAFLHADTLVSDAALSRLVRVSAQGTHCWGRFDIRIDDRGWPFRMIAVCMNLRSRLTGVATGDQLIFVHRALFEAVGGFPSIALMEDVSLSKSLRRIAAPLCCRETVLTSARRWRRRGTIRTVSLMWWLRLRYAMGADPQQLARMYRAAETDTVRGR